MPKLGRNEKHGLDNEINKQTGKPSGRVFEESCNFFETL